jgi:hypothetical protein
MQERERPAGAHDHACCLSAPRCLWLAIDGDSGPAAAQGGDSHRNNHPHHEHHHQHDHHHHQQQRLRLWQEPLPELSELRRRSARGRWAWQPEGRRAAAADGRGAAAAGGSLQVAPGLRTQHFEAEFELRRPAGDDRRGGGGVAAVVLQPFEGRSGAEGAAITFDWESSALQVGLGGGVQGWGGRERRTASFNQSHQPP